MIFFKKRGKGVRDATVSDFFFTKNPNLKKIKKFFFFFFFFFFFILMLGGGGGGAVVGEGGYSKRISLNKNPNVNKKMWGGMRG